MSVRRHSVPPSGLQKTDTHRLFSQRRVPSTRNLLQFLLRLANDHTCGLQTGKWSEDSAYLVNVMVIELEGRQASSLRRSFTHTGFDDRV